MLHSYWGQCGRVVLRPLAAEDIEPLRRMRNRERMWFVHSGVISGQGQRDWFERYKAAENDYMFSVRRADIEQVMIGAVALYNIDGSSGEFGRLLVDAQRAGEHGLGYDASACACRIGFEKLGLDRIYLYVLPGNPRAIRTYEKCGFQAGEERDGMLYMELLKGFLIEPQFV